MLTLEHPLLPGGLTEGFSGGGNESGVPPLCDEPAEVINRVPDMPPPIRPITRFSPIVPSVDFLCGGGAGSFSLSSVSWSASFIVSSAGDAAEGELFFLSINVELL